MMISVIKQVIHLPTKKTIFTVRDKPIDLLVHWYWTYFQKWKIKFHTKLQMFMKCIVQVHSEEVNTCIHSLMNRFLTKCVSSLFNSIKLQQITVICRLTNTSLYVLSTNTVHWSMMSILSLGWDQSFNRVRLYHDRIYL